jgi:hypothetical protein
VLINSSVHHGLSRQWCTILSKYPAIEIRPTKKPAEAIDLAAMLAASGTVRKKPVKPKKLAEDFTLDEHQIETEKRIHETKRSSSSNIDKYYRKHC